MKTYIFKTPFNAHRKLCGVMRTPKNDTQNVLDDVKPCAAKMEGRFSVTFDCTLEDIKQFDAHKSGSPAPLVSPKLAEIIRHFASDTVEFLDTDIITNNGRITDYQLVHITQMIQCKDEVNCIYSVHRPSKRYEPVEKLEKLAFHPNVLGDCHMVRDFGNFATIVVSEDLRNAILKANIQGVWLIEPQDLYPFSDENTEKLAQQQNSVFHQNT